MTVQTSYPLRTEIILEGAEATLGKSCSYVMNRRVLGILATYTLRGQFTEAGRKHVEGKTLVHVTLREFNGKSIRENYGHGKGILVYEGTVNEVLPVIIKALQGAGYEGSFGAENVSFTEQLLTTLRSFDPVPQCHKCREPLLEGQEVVSLRTGHRHHIFHSSCYEATLH